MNTGSLTGFSNKICAFCTITSQNVMKKSEFFQVSVNANTDWT